MFHVKHFNHIVNNMFYMGIAQKMVFCFINIL